MSEDEAAFIAKFAESPDDDLPRLAFCDWLEERDGNEDCSHCDGTGKQRYADAAGDMDERPCPHCNGTRGKPNEYAKRAEFIRVQIELAIKPTKQLEYREAELWGDLACPSVVRSWVHSTLPKMWATHLQAIPDNLPNNVTRVIVHRGFVSAVRCFMSEWIQHGRQIVQGCPIQRVEIENWHPQYHDGKWYWYEIGVLEPGSQLETRTIKPEPIKRSAAFDSLQAARDHLSDRCIQTARIEPKATAVELSGSSG